MKTDTVSDLMATAAVIFIVSFNQAIAWNRAKITLGVGRGCRAVGRTVASYTRGLFLKQSSKCDLSHALES